jgi:lipid-binding SYLF domain-containing protein
MQISITRVLIAALVSTGMLRAEDAQDRLQAAAVVLQEIMATSDRAIPQELLDKAECVVIIPGMIKGAFIIGANYGKGFMSCRTGNVGWSAPAAMRMEGGSFGFQIGGSSTDVIMLVLNKSGAEKMLSSKFTLGGDASVAAGPVGRTSTAETDAYMRAEILSWSRSRGAFAGISLKGATIRSDTGANQELYGRRYGTKAIVGGTVEPVSAAQPLLDTLNKYSSRKVAQFRAPTPLVPR